MALHAVRLEHYKLIVLIIFLLIILIAASSIFFNDFLDARIIKNGSPRLSVRQGDSVTLQLADSTQTRKLELCVEKKNFLLGYSDFSPCQTLQYSISPHVRLVPITIPRSFPLGRAVIITRIRSRQGQLTPTAPSDEKITLLITAGLSATPVPQGHPGEGAIIIDDQSDTAPSALKITPPPQFDACRADVNNDSYVSVTDLANIASHVGQKGSNLIWDLNGDGSVTNADLDLANAVIPSTCAPKTTPVPEINLCRDADMNGDHVISVTDLANIAARMGQSGSNLKGDINHDGSITQADLDLVQPAITTVCAN